MCGVNSVAAALQPNYTYHMTIQRHTALVHSGMFPLPVNQSVEISKRLFYLDVCAVRRLRNFKMCQSLKLTDGVGISFLQDEKSFTFIIPGF